MIVRGLMILGVTVALAGCAKNSQETEALSPPPSARDTTRARMQQADSVRTNSVQTKGDSTIRVTSDSVKTPAQ